MKRSPNSDTWIGQNNVKFGGNHNGETHKRVNLKVLESYRMKPTFSFFCGLQPIGKCR